MNTTMQDRADFQAGRHDFQTDIELLASSKFVRTILETVMLATGMRFAAVARVTADRWVACRTVDEVDFGLLEGDEIEIQSTFCQSVRETSERVIFNDVAMDQVFRDHPIALRFGIASYASFPIYRSDGSFFGTLCAIDTEPRNVKNPRSEAMLEMFAKIIGLGLEGEERLQAQERHVEHHQRMARLQEEFVAVLGHDLRNPVAAMGAGIRQLDHEPISTNGRTILRLMRASVHRMNDLIDNIMLHAKARLGGGIRVTATPDAPLSEAITHVVEEIRSTDPDQPIILDLTLDRPVGCDAPRVAQAVSNLLSNAVRYGAENEPIEVRGAIIGQEVALAVTNRGPAVSDDMRRKLFQPFQRGTQTDNEGLGLGLHIASSIATAHNGRIDVKSEDGLTTFMLRLPLLPNNGSLPTPPERSRSDRQDHPSG